MMFMSSHIYSDLELHARFWVFTAEAAPAKPPEHKITVKELAAFVLQDADNIVKNSKWSVNDNSMYIFTWIGLHREIVNWWNELQFNLSNINTCTLYTEKIFCMVYLGWLLFKDIKKYTDIHKQNTHL